MDAKEKMEKKDLEKEKKRMERRKKRWRKGGE